ncbi:MAG: S24 family peptidase [Candidatus Kapabacteria bacterium]|nr:S24 family peptidase [Candidatus Kapabacteria bacterium]
MISTSTTSGYAEQFRSMTDHELYRAIYTMELRANQRGNVNERKLERAYEECERRLMPRIYETAQSDAGIVYHSEQSARYFYERELYDECRPVKITRIDFCNREELRAEIRSRTEREMDYDIDEILSVRGGWLLCDVHGNSMNLASIHSGDIVLMREVERMLDGRIHIVTLRGRTLIKRAVYANDGIELRSESTDARHQTMVVPVAETDTMSVLGCVEWVLKKV